MTWIDDFSPTLVGADRIKISLDPRSLTPKAFDTTFFLIDYSGAALDGGIVLPLELIIQAPTSAGFVRSQYKRLLPTQVAYAPISSGPHLIRLAEVGHNRFFGSLRFTVAGDPIDLGSNRRRVPR